MDCVVAPSCLEAKAPCVDVCPVESIILEMDGCGTGRTISIEPLECSDCVTCLLSCSVQAIS